jgi:capsular exopolysaccharide synthesis family protein
LAGLALAAAYVFVREQLDQSLKDPASVEKLFGLPLLGAIPQEEIDSIDEELGDPKSTLSEAYLSAVSNLSFLTPQGAPRSFTVASTRPNEGKSTTAYALAAALARVGKTAVLVDCDLRNPSQHEFFDVPKEPGLSSVLSSGVALDELDQLCRRTGVERLDFLPAGPLLPNPGTLLSSERLGEVVRKLLTRYDHVVVDGPPLLGLADALLIAKAVDGVIYTIEANGLRIRGIQTGLRRLQFTGAQLFGAIVTKLSAANSAYGYGENYGYGYRYGSNDATA